MNMTIQKGAMPLFPIAAKGPLSKGDLKMIILNIISDRPVHGYEISRIITDRSHGFYKPSPGSIYPALRSLLDAECIKVNPEGRRKIYQITPKGRRLIEGRKAEIERCMKAFKESLGPDRALLFEELLRTGKLIAIASKDMTSEQARAVAKVIEEAREKMLRIISK